MGVQRGDRGYVVSACAGMDALSTPGGSSGMEGIMRIDVSGHQFTFPQVCACCGAPPDTVWTVSASRSRGKRVVHTTSKRWDVPYCKECAGHASLYRSAAGIALLAFVVGGVLALIVGDALGALVFALAILSSIMVFWRLRARATAQRKAACSVSGPAVNYLGWEGTV